jgi:heme/copper-type cytochrome/quinol oxidase subunit 2
MPTSQYRRSPHGPGQACTRRWRPGVFAAVVAACLMAPCRGAGVLDPQGPISSAERLILINATAIMLVVVLPVIVLTLVPIPAIPRLSVARSGSSPISMRT